MLESKENLNLLGAIVANLNNIILTAIFLARITKYPKAEFWLGALFISTIIPLGYLFVKAFAMNRPFLYFLQLALMIAFILMELLLDYILKIDFRQNRSLVIPYLTLFYASFGGMIGVASQNGKLWAPVTGVTFLAMVALSLFMHIKTGS